MNQKQKQKPERKRGCVPFRRNDVKRAIAAARLAGANIERIEFEDRKFSLIVGKPADAKAHSDELDRWVEKHNASQA